MITFATFNKQDYKNCFIVTDSKLSELYGIVGDNVFLLPQGEQAKSLDNATEICRWLLAHNAERGSTIVAVGGGSVGDTVGFAASIFKRGIALLHVPTTVVAQIDSSIGGKTAVNLDGVKNVLGTFYEADTLIDTDFLKTLDKRQMNNGYGELLKYRMLNDKIDKIALQDDWQKIVETCANYKQQVCAADPFDNGQRKILNFGHTVGHALELCCNMDHGEAVAIGLYYETLLAHKLGLCDKSYLTRWQGKIEKHFEIPDISRRNLQLVANDKKNLDGKVGVVLPCDGKFELRYLSTEQICQLLCND